MAHSQTDIVYTAAGTVALSLAAPFLAAEDLVLRVTALTEFGLRATLLSLPVSAADLVAMSPCRASAECPALHLHTEPKDVTSAIVELQAIGACTGASAT